MLNGDSFWDSGAATGIDEVSELVCGVLALRQGLREGGNTFICEDFWSEPED